MEPAAPVPDWTRLGPREPTADRYERARRVRFGVLNAVLLVVAVVVGFAFFDLAGDTDITPSRSQPSNPGIIASSTTTNLPAHHDEDAHWREYDGENFTSYYTPGQFGRHGFTLRDESRVGYDLEVPSAAGSFDACVYRIVDRWKFEENESVGWACVKGTRAAHETMVLPAGTYEWGTRCLPEARCTKRGAPWRLTATPFEGWEHADRQKHYLVEDANVVVNPMQRYVRNFTTPGWSLLHVEARIAGSAAADFCFFEPGERERFANGFYTTGFGTLGQSCVFLARATAHAGAHYPAGDRSVGIQCRGESACSVTFSVYWQAPRGAPMT